MIFTLIKPYKSALIIALLALMQSNVFAQDDELLPSEEAFAFSAVPTESGFDAKWTIADGYYMYRDKISFSLADKQGQAIDISYDYPQGKIKADPAFGDVEVYLKHVDFSIPVEGSQDVILTVKGQGCNEPIGVCYPPITHTIPITLLAANTSQNDPLAQVTPQMDLTPSANNSSEELSSISELRDLLGGGLADDELLPPDEAFKVAAIADREGINLRFDIADGYYLYQNKLSFKSDTHTLAPPQLPAGEPKQDEYFGEVTVYKHTFDALLKLASAEGSETISIDATYQGCAEAGVCYPPQTKTFTLAIPDLISPAAAQTIAAPTEPSSATVSRIEPEDKDSKALWWILFTAFIAGVGLTFTPCVLPLIPILSSVIAGQGENVTKSKAAGLAAIYVLGTAVAYAAIGAVAGATGDQLQAYFQNVWAIGTMAAIFFIMALSMFGLFEIQMPSFIQSRMSEKSQGIKGGSIPKVFVLGLLSALIVGACVSPVLISFLSIAIAKGSATLGALTMFAMALGMGIPLILLGMGAGHILPKAGMWMDKVKYVFGVMLVAVAIYLLSVLPGVPVLYLWAALFIIVAIYLGATQSLAEGASGWHKLFKGVGTLLLVWGVMALIGALYGQRDILNPLPERLFSSNAPSNGVIASNETEHIFTRVNTLVELDQHFETAKRNQKPIMIDYYADWCVECAKMEESTFKDATVRNVLTNDFIALQVDVTDPNNEELKSLKKRFGIFGPPAVIFFDRQGELIKGKSFYGYKNTEKFLRHIQSI